ncbi:hypothetical protein DFH11DRAFT_1550357 [Phellopilus nigrolimitatus]|nr:hypothetical protein DFH11DRAFT_1550357 [Phellopilus nigrolimitatus]
MAARPDVARYQRYHDTRSPFDGDLALQQDNGRYYYTSSLSAASASAANDDVSIGEHWLASQKTLAQPQSKSGSQSASLSTPDSLPRTADTPPEVRQLVPPACTDCSACGVFLDAFRYVCSTCGERTPRPLASPGANGHAIGRARRVRTSSCRCSTRSRTRRMPAPAAREKARKYLAAQTHKVIIPGNRPMLRVMGLINYQVGPDTRPTTLAPLFTDHFRVILDTPRGLQFLHSGGRPSPRDASAAINGAAKTGPGLPPASLELCSNIYQTTAKASRKISSSEVKPLQTVAHTPAQEALAFRAIPVAHARALPLAEKQGLRTLFTALSWWSWCGDFVKLTAPQSASAHGVNGSGDDGWSDQEILLLLQGIEMYDMTGLSLSRRGLEAPLLYARLPFEQADISVMSVVAFLEDVVGPDIAAEAYCSGSLQVQQFDSTPLIPKVSYLATLCHNTALCDHCMDRLRASGSVVDMQFFRIVVEPDNPGGSPPVLNYPVYYSYLQK